MSPSTPDQTKWQHLKERPFEIQDDWGESTTRMGESTTQSWGGSPHRSMSSTQGSPWRSPQSRRLKMGDSRSAPLLPAANSTHSSTWYSASDASSRTLSAQGPPLWSALAGTWRQRSTDEFGVSVRKNADDGSAFVHGCVPHWNATNLRKRKALEHALTWCYYQMRRHEMHPDRKTVGDPALPPEAVVEKMRSGTKHQFQFWRDLRPPFFVTGVTRDQESLTGSHPDGDLFHVVYQCGIDYVGERLWNENGYAGTFDNMIHGVAIVRIPDGPHRQISIVSWGRPTLNYTPKEQLDAQGVPIQDNVDRIVDPNEWMPISDELGLRADLPRFAACREATRKANRRSHLEVAPMQALLLGPHAILPKLAAQADAKGSPSKGPASPTKAASDHEGGSPSSPKKKRQHRIFTSAAGFVRYVG